MATKHTVPKDLDVVEPTAPFRRAAITTPATARCDLLVGLDGLHVTGVDFDDDVRGQLVVGVESPRAPMGCPSCGVIAGSHGRSDVTLVDSPCFDRPVRVVWRKRTWRCESRTLAKVFTEQNPDVAAPRALLTTRACWWAISQIRRERLDQRDRSTVGHDVEHGLVLDPAAAASGRRRGPVHRGEAPRCR
ncbi:MAG: hypothetical protein R2709_14130 [Marmoricola sp.]